MVLVLKKYGGLCLGLETQSLGLGLGLDKKVLFTSLTFTHADNFVSSPRRVLCGVPSNITVCCVQLSHISSLHVADLQLQGVQFVDRDGRAFGCTAYDSNEILFYQSTTA